ncbi:MAG: disulfide bond formation protein B [Hyphomicrobium aestuarii]|mgnify:CR=1 FL=1|nr:disulfide bond formation protein B [Hyphomicrobium aestuarii]
MLLAAPTTAAPSPRGAYGLSASVLIIALVVIATALAFEHIGGYAPCPLCLQQRYAYYAGVPLAALSLVLFSTGRLTVSAVVMFVVALGFLANAGLGVYHAGAEWKFWPGPVSCGTIQAIGSSGGGLLGALDKARVIACDEAPLRIAGLSFAGWNVVTSFGLFVLALKAAFSARG